MRYNRILALCLGLMPASQLFARPQPEPPAVLKPFFMDFVHGWIKTLDPDRPAQASTFVTGLRRPVDLRFGPDGTLYVLVRDAWVIDREFRPGTGSLLAIRFAGDKQR